MLHLKVFVDFVAQIGRQHMDEDGLTKVEREINNGKKTRLGSRKDRQVVASRH